MKVSKQVAAELADDQHADVIDDEKVIKHLEELGAVILDKADKEAIEGAVALIKAHNALLVEVEERKTHAIRGFHGSAGMITELETIIGGDVDLATGFACLRTEEGDDGAYMMVFLKGEVLGQVGHRKQEPDQLPEYRALVKRDGEITAETFDTPEKAVVSVINRTSDLIVKELLKSKEK
jgi:hypothetical protein